jgi:CMP-N-acetylneuraminic acid synthetase
METKSLKTVAFIFARGGSKGLPGKNIKPLLGKPLLLYSIEIAKNCPSIDDIFVSTDDEDIAKIAKEGGARVIERPLELATDSAPEWLAWQHAIKWVEMHCGKFGYFVSLPATSPLRSVLDVESAINTLKKSDTDICIGISSASRSPYFNMVKFVNEYEVEVINKLSKSVTRRQDSPDVFDVTTVVYVSRPKYVMESVGLFDGKVSAIAVPKERSIDIDDIYDFKMAEVILRGDSLG